MNRMRGKRALTRDEVLAALPGYVLDALEPDEKAAVEDYLRRHPELSDRVRDLDAAGAALAEAAPIHPLPETAKQRVMARVRADVQPERASIGARVQRPRAHAVPTRAVPAHDGPAREGTAREGPAPLGRVTPTRTDPRYTLQPDQSLLGRIRRWWAERRYANFALGLATALAVLLLVAALRLQTLTQNNAGTLEQLQARVATLESENVTLRSENEVLQTAIANQREQWATILAADREVLLAGTEDLPTAQAVFYADGEQVLVIADGLNPLDSAQTYQLWLIPGEGAPVSAGLFAAQEAGATTYQAASPLALGEYSAVGVSVEPAGGSESPTGPIVLLGEIG